VAGAHHEDIERRGIRRITILHATGSKSPGGIALRRTANARTFRYMRIWRRFLSLAVLLGGLVTAPCGSMEQIQPADAQGMSGPHLVAAVGGTFQPQTSGHWRSDVYLRPVPFRLTAPVTFDEGTPPSQEAGSPPDPSRHPPYYANAPPHRSS
jgi:hypothetical protein